MKTLEKFEAKSRSSLTTAVERRNCLYSRSGRLTPNVVPVVSTAAIWGLPQPVRTGRREKNSYLHPESNCVVSPEGSNFTERLNILYIWLLEGTQSYEVAGLWRRRAQLAGERKWGKDSMSLCEQLGYEIQND
jgi:hypothetical protein